VTQYNWINRSIQSITRGRSNIGVAAIGAMGAKAPLTRKGTYLSGTRKY